MDAAEEDSRLPDIRDYTAARQALESNSFASKFPGNISDFSEAERIGFEQAAREVYSLGDGEVINFEYFYKCCSVHFKRSVARVKSNHRIIPMQLADTFQHYVNILLKNDTSKEIFDHTVDLMRRDFPLVKNWIDWYLEPNRGKLIFPALAAGNIVGHGSDTNAQEGAGRWIKDAHPKQSKPDADECLQAMYNVALQIHHDINDEKLGKRTRYGHKSNPIEREEKRARKGKPAQKVYNNNDGKAPEKTSELITIATKSTGRPKGAKSMAPLGETMVNLSLAIIWSFSNFYHAPSSKSITATNTCPLDVVMMALFLLRKYDDDLYFAINQNEDLRKILDLVQREQGAHARVDWVNHVLERDPSSPIVADREVSFDGVSETWDMAGVILSQMGAPCEHLFQFEVTDDYGLCQPSGYECPFFDHLDAVDDQSAAVEDAETEGDIYAENNVKKSPAPSTSVKQHSTAGPEHQHSLHTFLISGEGKLGMKFTCYRSNSKVVVVKVDPDSVAMKHGIQEGDEIVPMLSSVSVLAEENKDMYKLLLDAMYTQKVRFQVKRRWNKCADFVVNEGKALHRFILNKSGRLGITLSTSEENSSLTRISGVEANSLADIHGLQVDDIICVPNTNGSEAGDPQYCNELLGTLERPLVIEVLRDVGSTGPHIVNSVDRDDLKNAPHDPLVKVEEIVLDELQRNPFVFSYPKSFNEPRSTQSKKHIGVPVTPRNTITGKHISVPAGFMHNLQSYLDTYYNTKGPGEEVDCDGRGTDLPRDYVTGRLICGTVCGGKRYLRKFFNREPTLLHIEADGGEFLTYHNSQANPSLPNMDSIEKSLVINGTRYLLVQANLYNGIHFRGVTVLMGKYLMFDGMWRGRRLRYIGGNTLFKKYSVTSLWYKLDGKMKKEGINDGLSINNSKGKDTGDNEDNTKHIDGIVVVDNQDIGKKGDINDLEIITQEVGDKGVNDASENADKTGRMKRSSKRETIKRSSKRERKKPKRADDTPEQQQKKARKQTPRHPLGITIQKVHERGKIPTCRYCQQELERGELHMVKTSISSHNKHWRDPAHYHFECSVQVLTHDESSQLVTIMRKSDEVSEEATKGVENNVKQKRKEK